MLVEICYAFFIMVFRYLVSSAIKLLSRLGIIKVSKWQLEKRRIEGFIF